MDYDDFLEHYGKKGMKWGVTNGRSTSLSVSATGEKSRVRRGPQDVKVVQKGAKGVVATGGKRGVAKSEAVKTAATRQVAKKSGVHTLTNKDLKESIERMRLEQQFNELSSAKKKKGRGFITSLISDGPKIAKEFNALAGK